MTGQTRQIVGSSFFLPLLPLLFAGIAWGQSGTGTLSSVTFGMQCGTGKSSNCPVVSGTITLPTEPGTLRLWDSDVDWSHLNPNESGSNQWDWTTLDEYLEAIVNASNVQNVIYTFGWVPCWDTANPTTDCNGPATSPNGSSYPPNDLDTTSCGPNGSGSSTFNSFVQELTKHCDSNNHCVKDLIKYYEMWNEANASFWGESGWSQSTSAEELYCLVAPATKIIKNNVSSAKILTPSINAATGYETWMEDWLGDEVSGGVISNYYNIHTYLKHQTPEQIYANTVVNQLAPNTTVSGWTALPWLMSETNFDPSTLECDNTDVSDCTGQIVRWQSILNSNAAINVSWYFWNTTIGDYGDSSDLNPTYAEAYYYMMQYIEGGKFTSACSYTGSGTTEIWTCAFKDTNSNSDLWAWTNNETNQSYSAPSGYLNYWDLTGACHAIPSTGFTVSVEPYLLVKTSCSVEP
jgi:hypothetical protein